MNSIRLLIHTCLKPLFYKTGLGRYVFEEVLTMLHEKCLIYVIYFIFVIFFVCE
jgi:hypothetical protein